MLKTKELRKRYPVFLYKSYSSEYKKGGLHISFDFAVPPDILFHPRVVVKNVSPIDLKRVGKSTLKNLIFHLGLIEMISYWKATCSSEIVVEAGHLTKQQIAWWHDLIMKGMGEYFYKNKINFTEKNFLTLTLGHPHYDSHGYINKTKLYQQKLKKQTLVPVGGGKDAVVTLELLKKIPHRAFLLNPKQEQLAILKIARAKNPIVVERTIDPRLLELNRGGYLNGHTPFSAYLAFLTTLVAILFNHKYIALSNERSSNEGNVRYLGKTINHQYSKSFDFEKRFRSYTKTYLAKEVEYFSFLRPLYELQIARMFARYPKYFPAFLSCNEAHKTTSGTRKPTGIPAFALRRAQGYGEARWCGKCAKCLFVFISLYPFIGEKQTTKIFKKNLLKDKMLKPLLGELMGKRKFKPFECVGTTRESKVALLLSLQKKKDHQMLKTWSNQHFLPPSMENILKSAVTSH